MWTFPVAGTWTFDVSRHPFWMFNAKIPLLSLEEFHYNRHEKTWDLTIGAGAAAHAEQFEALRACKVDHQRTRVRVVFVHEMIPHVASEGAA